MADTTDLDALATQIATDATGPQSVTVDGVTVQQRSLRDQLDVLKSLEARRAASRFPLGKPVKLNSPGAVD
jgi:hypothetical protein